MNKRLFATWKDVAKIALGTASGQIFLLLISPLLTRLYSPEDFGLYTSFVALSATLSAISSLRIEQAIYLIEDEKKRLDLIKASLFISCCISFLVLFIVELVASRTFLNDIHGGVILLIVSMLSSSLFMIFSTYATANQAYNTVGLTRLYQSVCGGVAQLIIGSGFGISTGLIIGQIVGQCLGIYELSKRISGSLLRRFDLISTIKEQKNFIFFAAPANLLSNIALLLPPILLGKTYGYEIVGFYALGQRLIASPMYIIGGAISQVYSAEFGKSLQDGYGLKVFTSNLRKTVFMGIAVFIFSLLMPHLIIIIFGEKWNAAGTIIILMIPSAVMQIVSTPMASTLNLLGKQSLQLRLDIVRVLITVSAIEIPARAGVNYQLAIAVYSLSLAGVYLLNLIIAFRFIKAKSLQGVSK